jgi:hypothetical protein
MKRWSRKGRCPECNVGTGSNHSRGCSWLDKPTPIAKRISGGYNAPQKGEQAMKNKIIAAILMLGIWVPFLLITIEEVSNHSINFGFSETALVIAGVCIFAALPLASIQLIRK